MKKITEKTIEKINTKFDEFSTRINRQEGRGSRIYSQTKPE